MVMGATISSGSNRLLMVANTELLLTVGNTDCESVTNKVPA